MTLFYRAETPLRALLLDLIQVVAPSCLDLDLHLLPGPYQSLNWRIGRLDVLAEEYDAARDHADWLEAQPNWIMVPDGHVLVGR